MLVKSEFHLIKKKKNIKFDLMILLYSHVGTSPFVVIKMKNCCNVMWDVPYKNTIVYIIIFLLLLLCAYFFLARLVLIINKQWSSCRTEWKGRSLKAVVHWWNGPKGPLIDKGRDACGLGLLFRAVRTAGNRTPPTFHSETETHRD